MSEPKVCTCGGIVPHPRSSEHYARVERERIAGESFLKALKRLAVEDAVAAYPTHRAAAQKLGETEQSLHRAIEAGRERRVNAQLGMPERNAHGNRKPWHPARQQGLYMKRMRAHEVAS